MSGVRNPFRWRAFASCVGVLLAATLAGCASQNKSVAPGDWYQARKSVKPKGARIYVCDTFGCKRRTPVQLTDGDLAALERIIRRGAASPRAERRALGKAVQWFERRVGPVVGSTRDKGGWDWDMAGKRGHMDCIDEATNTTSILLVAQREGMLRHHTVGHPASKGYFLDRRYPHATAVVVVKGTGSRYAIDSWVHDNGQPPVIMPLDAWYKARRLT